MKLKILYITLIVLLAIITFLLLTFSGCTIPRKEKTTIVVPMTPALKKAIEDNPNIGMYLFERVQKALKAKETKKSESD